MTTPIGNNPQNQVDLAGLLAAIKEQGEAQEATGGEVNGAVTTTFHEKVQQAARELIDQLQDDSIWDAKMGSLENRFENVEQQKVQELLQQLGLIAGQGTALQQIQANAPNA